MRADSQARNFVYGAENRISNRVKNYTNCMRKIFCAVVAAFLCCCGFSYAPSGGNARNVPVIMYHSVCKTNVGEFVISPDSLRADFEYLKKNGYTSVWVRDIIAFCEGKGTLPPKPVVLSFDDGFYNNAFYAEKIAAECGMKITMSIVGSYVQSEEGQKKRSPVYSYLNAADLARLYGGGRVEFCNHTYDMHKSSPRKGLRRKRGETYSDYERAIKSDSEKCRALVQSACGYRMNVFAYPFGCYSKETQKILSDMGYKAILTCKGGINVFRKGSSDGLYDIMRYNRHGKADTKEFFKKIKVL